MILEKRKKAPLLPEPQSLVTFLKVSKMTVHKNTKETVKRNILLRVQISIVYSQRH
jgi:hypothetical protein